MVMTFRTPRLRLPRPHLLTNERTFVDFVHRPACHALVLDRIGRESGFRYAFLRKFQNNRNHSTGKPDGGRTFLRILISRPSFLEIALKLDTIQNMVLVALNLLRSKFQSFSESFIDFSG